MILKGQYIKSEYVSRMYYIDGKAIIESNKQGETSDNFISIPCTENEYENALHSLAKYMWAGRESKA